VELVWVGFAALNVLVIVSLAELETIPFHLIWVSLTIVYGYRVWSGRATAAALVAVSVVTGAALAIALTRSARGYDELAEVPLMAAMFVAMIWHARRRQVAVEQARRMAENEHRLLERQREFVRDASHELRTPITIALGHAELLGADVADPQAAHDAHVIVDELGRLARLSERLLQLASAEDVDLFTISNVDPVSLMEETFRRWQPTAPRAWRLRTHLERGTIVPADADRLRDALDALIENAVEATSEGEAITLGASPRGTDAVLEVSDGGVGMDPERIPSMFERFGRADPPRSRQSGGAGLGLSIVAAIVAAHGGTVEAESSLGEGTTIRLVVPGLRSGPAVGANAVPVDARAPETIGR
jgi:signal transduction histidine kinase